MVVQLNVIGRMLRSEMHASKAIFESCRFHVSSILENVAISRHKYLLAPFFGVYVCEVIQGVRPIRKYSSGPRREAPMGRARFETQTSHLLCG
jgi:hypothetical protein